LSGSHWKLTGNGVSIEKKANSNSTKGKRKEENGNERKGCPRWPSQISGGSWKCIKAQKGGDERGVKGRRSVVNGTKGIKPKHRRVKLCEDLRDFQGRRDRQALKLGHYLKKTEGGEKKPAWRRKCPETT